MAADATIQGLRVTLEEERDSLRRQLAELGYGSKGLDYDPNFADSSQVTAERGENEALVNKLVEGLKDVERRPQPSSTTTPTAPARTVASRSPGSAGGQTRGPPLHRLRGRGRPPALRPPRPGPRPARLE